MAGVTLGFLRYVLGFDTLAFEKGASKVDADLKKMQRNFERQGTKIVNLGQKLTLGLTAPLLAFAGKGIAEAQETAAAMAQVNAALQSMGPVAGRTADQLEAAANAFEGSSLFEADQILKDVTANLLTFGNIAGKSFDRAQQAAIDLATRLNIGPKEAAIQVGKALNDPIKGITALGRAGIQFSSDQKAMIKSLVETGQTAKAQEIILKELERQFGGAAKAAQLADPANAAADAFKQLAETVGTALLPILPRIAEAIKAVADAFTSLPKGAQTALIVLGGLGAVAGPALIGVGALVGSLGKLVPLLAGAGAAEGGAIAFSGALAGIAPVAIPAAAAIAGIVFAFNHWDEIKPKIDAVQSRFDSWAQGVQDRADEIDRRLGIPTRTELFDTIAEGFDKDAKAAADNRDSLVTTIDAWLAKLNEEDVRFEQWVDSQLAGLQDWAKGVDARLIDIWHSFETNWNRITASTAAMTDKVKAYLTTKLQSAWATVKEQAEKAAGHFYKLYDRVVGHSYIPDMVDGIAAEMARLQAVMVEPARATTQSAGEAFRQLQQDVGSLLAELFPDEARQNQLLDDIRLVTTAADKGAISADTMAAALERLNSRLLEVDGVLPEGGSFGLGAVGANAAKALGDAADAYLAKAPKIQSETASWGATLQQIGQDFTNVLGNWLTQGGKLKDLFKQLVASALQLLVSPGGPLGNIFGGARAGGGSVSAGRTYLVGEKGPELFAPAASGRIVSNDNLRTMHGGGGHTQIFNISTPDADSFRKSQGQIRREAKRNLGMGNH